MIKVAVIMGKMHAGGKKNLVMEYYRHINREKVQFDFFCDEDSNSIPYEEIANLGGKVYVIPPYQKIFSNMLTMRRIFKENNYNILHGYNSTMNIFAIFVGKVCGIPVRINESISMGHRNDRKNFLKNILKPFSRLFATHYMSNGEVCGRWQFGDKMFQSGKVKVFKTVIDVEKFSFDPLLREKCRKEYGIEDNIVIGHIGRFTAQKNSFFVLDIIREAVKIEPKVKLLLIGHGELEEEMLKRIKQYDIEDNVLFLGKREDIIQFYNAMDSFLLPSLYEGLPVVGVEAECCGLPMFFSKEIPRESSPCSELGFFIGLDKGAKFWASKVVENTRKSMSSRKNRALDVKNAGFDSEVEGVKLTRFYEELVDGR